MTRLSVLLAAIAVSSSVNADIKPWPDQPATDSDMTLIREAMGLDVANADTEALVWKVEGFRSFYSEDAFNLVGVLWTKPILAQDELCMLSRYEILGESSEAGYEWSNEPWITYDNWLPEEENGCALDDPAELVDSVATYDLIPTDALVQIIKGSVDLIEAVLAHPDAEQFRDSGREWRLTEVRLPVRLMPDLGVPYETWLQAPDAQSGPTVLFSIKQGQFIIHSVGFWIS